MWHVHVRTQLTIDPSGPSAQGKPLDSRHVAMDLAVLPDDKRLVSRNLVKWLHAYRNGKGMACKVKGDEVVFG